MDDQPIEKSDRLVELEKAALRKWRQGREHEPWTGIALSGGGIRSATFCLGILRALADKNLLRHFDYISTVSGGGYTGCSLQWWWSAAGKSDRASPDPDPEPELGTGRDNFPFGTSEPGTLHGQGDDRHKYERLKRLRDHGNYLAPGQRINYYSLIGATLRAIALNLLVWIPLLGFTFYGVSWLDDVLKPAWEYFSLPEHVSSSWLSLPLLTPVLYKVAVFIAASLVLIFILACTFYSFQSWDSQEGQRQDWDPVRTVLYLTLTLASIGMVVWAWVLPDSDFDVVNVFGIDPHTFRIVFRALLIVTALVTFARLWKATVLRWLLKQFPNGVGEAYAYRRMIDYCVGRLFPLFLLIAAFGLIPAIFEYMRTASPEMGVLGGMVAVSIGAASAVWGYYQVFRNLAPRLATTVFLPLGGALFLIGVAVLGFYFALGLKSDQPATQFALWGLKSDQPFVQIGLWMLVFLSLVSAWVVNINQIGLNRFYRDRLMEAYMPNRDVTASGGKKPSPAPDKEKPSPADDGDKPSPADDLYLCKLWENAGQPARPYPLINTNVVLVNDSRPEFRQRGGDNFLLSPLYCGSCATGWNETKEALPQLSLPTAMAASAAAVNPFSGYVGRGPTLGRIVSVVMALLNLRLGFWVRNPAKRSSLKLNLRVPNHIVPGLWYAVFKTGHQSGNNFLALTDGGHFDNLGIYELVRRRCKLIIVCDGEMDKETAYAAFVSVQRRIKDDFRARIFFDPDQGPELLVESTKMDYPSGAFMADQTYFVAGIEYDDGSTGKIVYIKARMIQELSFEVKAYKGAFPDFPHETTADQFFDPEQFDAHCELGYRACKCARSSIEALLTAQDIVARAVKRFNEDGPAVFDLINSGSEEFRTGGHYAFVHGIGEDAKVVAYGGPPLNRSPIKTLSRDFVDSDGWTLGQIAQTQARADGIWLDYHWKSRKTRKPDKKSSWVVRAGDYIFGCVVYDHETGATANARALT